MKIDEQLIDYLSNLSRLELVRAEKDALGKDIENILSYVEKLTELDTEGLPEMTHPFDASNRFRNDEITNTDRSASLLAGAPDRKASCFRVPRTVEE
jgi:aspartyl-tRNA(Asn)/glutamyl-tRNA(Gln) amidotransferase subunit C